MFDGESGRAYGFCVFVPLVPLLPPRERETDPSQGAGIIKTGDVAIGHAATPEEQTMGAEQQQQETPPGGSSASASGDGGRSRYILSDGELRNREEAYKHGLGCTVFWPGSHRHVECVHLGSVAATALGAVVSGAPLRAGGALVYDYRLVHCAAPNDYTPEDDAGRIDKNAPAQHEQVTKRSFFSHLCIKTNILPRQARDKHREKLQKRDRFVAGTAAAAPATPRSSGQ
jgi:hypothetical protein